MDTSWYLSIKDNLKMFRKGIVIQYIKIIRNLTDMIVIFSGVNKNGHCNYKGVIGYTILNKMEYFLLREVEEWKTLVKKNKKS